MGRSRAFYNRDGFQHSTMDSSLFWMHPDYADSNRIARYRKAWKYYYGNHWKFPTRRDGSGFITLNFVKFFIDHHISWLIDQGVLHKTVKGSEHSLVPLLNSVWKFNGQDELLRNMLLTGYVSGDTISMVYPEEATAPQLAINRNHPGNIRIVHYDSSMVSIDYSTIGTSRRDMHKVTIRQPYYDWSKANFKDGTPEVRYTTQIISNDHVEVYDGNGALVSETENKLGEIPIVHGRNMLATGDTWGTSDVDILIELQKTVNKVATDIQDVVDYDASPITVIYGATAQNIKKAPGRVWSNLPEKGKVEYLKLDGKLDVHHKWIETLIDSMFLFARASKSGILGEATSIRGVGLESLWKSDIQEANSKAASYGEAIGKIDYFILRYAERMGMLDSPPLGLCSECGGKVAVFNAGRTTKCLEVDKDSTDFSVLPAERSVKYKEWKALNELFKRSVKEDSADATEGASEKFSAADKLIASGLVKEPEILKVTTGDGVETNVVSIECNAHNIQHNPYAVDVKFVTALPRDRMTESELYNQYQANGWIDRAYARSKLDLGVQEDTMAQNVVRDMVLFGVVKQIAGISSSDNSSGSVVSSGKGTSSGSADKNATSRSLQADKAKNS